MNKIGYVASCVGLKTTADLLDVTYQELVANYYSLNAFTSTHVYRLRLVSEILAKSGCTVNGANITAWFTTPMRMLNGCTPMQFISTWKPNRDPHVVRRLILCAPAPSHAALDLAA